MRAIAVRLLERRHDQLALHFFDRLSGLKFAMLGGLDGVIE